ncbi:MAG TPA: hypothetical protein VKP61_00480 [Candidatus Acidoferrum sp.]|nr:hypothetical protein [Candidatus Acidoferrum sp.]
MQAFRYLALVLLLWLGPACLAGEVTIRVINANDGRPLINQPVSISLLYEKGETTPAKYDANLSLKTDANGEVRFVLPNPAPAHMAAQVRLTSEHWHCGCMVLAITQEVIQKGIVDSAASASESRKSPALVKAVPGEILFVARPLSFWERLLYPFVKG